MTEVFNILRKAREDRHLTLADIADATLINIEHLRAIDSGRVDILPEAYIRAFMREYAAYVGLDPSDIMQMFDEERGLKPKQAEPAADDTRSRITSIENVPTSDWSKRLVGSGQYTRTVVTLVGLAIVAVVAWNLFGTGRTTIRETPFREVVRENEVRSGIASGKAPDGNTAGDSLRATALKDDSLTLAARTTDSVWVRMMIDDTAPREYLFGPKAKVTWRARSQFLFFTIGNAGGLELTLDGKALGPAGKPGRVVQKLVITRKGIVIPGSDIAVKKDEGPADSSTEGAVPQEGPRDPDLRHR